jgi:hypothetical protein
VAFAAQLPAQPIIENMLPVLPALEIHALGLDQVVASIPSNEVTSEKMHANIYPAIGAAPPAGKIIPADPAHVLALLHALPDHPVIQINHPRFRYQLLFASGTA